MSDKPNPMAAAQRLAKPEPPRRFYKVATVGAHGDGWGILLDGKVARTPGRHALVVDSAAVAEALAAEWERQGERLNPADMPLTRIANSALDHVAGMMAEVRAEIVRYAGSDLVCYRADGPDDLIAAQAAAWDPLVAWARTDLGAPLVMATGVNHVTQPAEVSVAIAAVLAPLDVLSLAAVSTATTLAGSAVIALALQRGRLSVDQAWAAAHVDEDWQMSRWGADGVALGNRALRKREFDGAGVILAGRSRV